MQVNRFKHLPYEAWESENKENSEAQTAGTKPLRYGSGTRCVLNFCIIQVETWSLLTIPSNFNLPSLSDDWEYAGLAPRQNATQRRELSIVPFKR